MDVVPTVALRPGPGRECPAGEGRLECEVGPARGKIVQVLEHDPPSLKRHALHVERGQAARESIGIHEMLDAKQITHQGRGKRGLAGAVWAGQDHDVRHDSSVDVVAPGRRDMPTVMISSQCAILASSRGAIGLGIAMQ